MARAGGEGRVRIRVDGVALEVPAGISVAAALINQDIWSFRRSVGGESRAPLCAMGTCFECRVRIDGVAQRRACLETVAPGMEVDTRE